MKKLRYLILFSLVGVSGGMAGAVAGFGLRDYPQTGGMVRLTLTGTAAALFLWLLVIGVTGLFGRPHMGHSARRSAWAIASGCILPLLYLPLLIAKYPKGSEPWPDVVPVPLAMDPPDQIILVMAASAGLVLAMLAWGFPVLRKGPLAWITRHPAITLAVLLPVTMAGFSAMDLIKNHHLNGFANVPIFTEALLNINSSHGPLYSYMLQASGSSLLGVHGSFIWYLIYPLFLIWPTGDWLIIMSDVALALGAVPVYFIARRYFSTGVSLLFALVFLFNRVVVGQAGAGELSEERFLPLLFLSTFYFWQVRRFIPFAIFALLMITVREDAGIMLAGIGILSLVGRRGVVWWLAPIAVGIGWFAVMTGVLIPAMNPVGMATRPQVIYSQFGDSTGEILSTIASRPWLIFEAVFSNFMHKMTAYHIFLSFGFGLPLFSFFSILALPASAETLLTQSAYPEHLNMTAVAATIFPALIGGIAFVDRLIVKRWHVRAATGLVLVCLFCSLMLTATWYSTDRFLPRDNYESSLRMLRHLPGDATVIMPGYLLVRGETTQIRASYYQIPYEIETTGRLVVEQEYVLLDMRTLPFFKRHYDGFLVLVDTVTTSTDYELVDQADELYLFRKKQKPARIVTAPPQRTSPVPSGQSNSTNAGL